MTRGDWLSRVAAANLLVVSRELAGTVGRPGLENLAFPARLRTALGTLVGVMSEAPG